MNRISLRADRRYRSVSERLWEAGLATAEPNCFWRYVARAGAALLLGGSLLVAMTPADAEETPASPDPVVEIIAPAGSEKAPETPALDGDGRSAAGPTASPRLAGFKPVPLARLKRAAARKQAEENAPKGGEWTFSGLVDWYFGINARAPHQPVIIQTPEQFPGGIKVDNSAMYFNVRDRELSFSLGEINITRTPGKGFPLGFTGTFTVGDAAKLFHATEPGGTSSWYPFHNLYFTYPFKAGSRDVGVDFGIFASPFGSEVLESSSNDSYSRAYTFWYAVPFYHMGIRASTNLLDNLSFQFGLVNGWNDIADSNDGKTIYTQFIYKPTPRFTQIIGWIGGLEGTGAFGPVMNTRGGGGVTINLLDVQSIYQITDQTKVAAWVAYGSATGSYVARDRSLNRLTGNWLGLVGYAKHQINDSWAVAARVEQFEDMPRTGFSPRFGVEGYLKVQGLTLTLEYAALRGRLVSRLEYRHDHANQAIFNAGAGSARDQDTFYFGQVFKF